MTEFEKVENNEYVPTESDVIGCLRVCESLPVASAANLGEVYFLNGNQEGYTKSHTYKCILDEARGVYTWEDQHMGKYAVGNCKNIKFRMLDKKVIISWEDPDDEEIGAEKVIWAKTTLVWRKGRMPQSPDDGNRQAESVERNQYALFGTYSFDIPNYDPSARYYFKLFPITTENVINNDDLNGRSSTFNYVVTAAAHPWYKDSEGKFKYNSYFKRVLKEDGTYSYDPVNLTDPQYFIWVSDTQGDRYEFKAGAILYEYASSSMNWAAVKDIVSSGAGPSLFPVGTIFVLPYHGDYGEMEFEVRSHDTEDLADKTKRHSMTLAAVHAPQWWDKVKDDTTAGGYGKSMSYDYGNRSYYTASGHITGATDFVVRSFSTSEINTPLSRTNQNGKWNAELAKQMEGGWIRSERNKDSGDHRWHFLIESMTDAVAEAGKDSDIYMKYEPTDRLTGSRDGITECPYLVKYDNENNAKTYGPVAGMSSIPNTEMFVNSDGDHPHDDAYAKRVDRETIGGASVSAEHAGRCWDDSLIDSNDGSVLYKGVPTAWDQQAFFFPENKKINNLLLPFDICGGINSANSLNYFDGVKWLIPVEPLMRRGVHLDPDSSLYKYRGDKLQNMLVITPFVKRFITHMQPRTSGGDKVDGKKPDSWCKRYHTYPEEIYKKDGSQTNFNQFRVIELFKDLIHVATQDDVFLRNKRYWKRTYYHASEDVGLGIPYTAYYYKPDTSGRTYTDVNGNERPYLRRSGIPANSSASELAKYYRVIMTRMFNHVYQLTETPITETRTVTAAKEVVWLRDESYGGEVGEPFGGNMLRYLRKIFVAGQKIEGGAGYVDLNITTVASGTFEKGKTYFEYVDDGFVQLRSNKRYYRDAAGTDQTYTETNVYDYREGDSIADSLFTAGAYIPILNDVPRFVKKGSDWVWTYDDGTHKCTKDCFGNTLTDNVIPSSFINQDKYAYRHHGGVVKNSSDAWDVYEICEAPITSYDKGAEGDYLNWEHSGLVTQLYWKGANMQRVPNGCEVWATSTLRQYLNGPFDKDDLPVGYRISLEDTFRYYDYGASPCQQYVYSRTMESWVTRFSEDEYWYKARPSLNYAKINSAVTFQDLGRAFKSGMVESGIASVDTPVINIKFKRDIEGVDKTDIRNTITSEIALPRQSFLHGFLDCQYKRSKDTISDPSKNYYYKNPYGEYEKLNNSEVFVRGGPYSHCLYELNPEYRKDIEEAAQFLDAIQCVVTKTKLRDPNKDGAVDSYEQFQHTDEYVTTIDKVWIFSENQVLSSRSSSKSGWEEGNSNIYGEDNVAGFKYTVRYGYHGLTTYDDKFSEVDGEHAIFTTTRTPDRDEYGTLSTVKWDHSGRCKSWVSSASAKPIRASDNMSFIPMFAIG